jgi:hypothetical protein
LGEAGTKSRMTMNDLTAPLGQGPRRYRRTIVDGKTGAKREVIVAAPPEPTSADTTGQLPSALPSKLPSKR